MIFGKSDGQADTLYDIVDSKNKYKIETDRHHGEHTRWQERQGNKRATENLSSETTSFSTRQSR
jgi:hypothetical protein